MRTHTQRYFVIFIGTCDTCVTHLCNKPIVQAQHLKSSEEDVNEGNSSDCICSGIQINVLLSIFFFVHLTKNVISNFSGV